MKYSKTILFLSPVFWNHPNKQTQYLASEFSARYNVLFFYTYGKPYVSIGKALTVQSCREKMKNLYLKLFSKKQTLCTELFFLTSREYEQMEQLSFFDSKLFLFQMRLYIWISQSNFQWKNFVLWANTCFFAEEIKHLKIKNVFFDFYDRYFDAIHDENNKIHRQNEEWLVQNSEKIFINSSFYKNFLIKYGTDKKKIIKVPVGYKLTEHLKVNHEVKKKKIVVGYAGAITNRLDFDLVENVVKENQNIQFTFVGPIIDLGSWMFTNKKVHIEVFVKKLKKYKNVVFLQSEQDVESQVQVMKKFSIGWIPYDTSVLFNFYSNPTKFYEYSAIGLPVISTKLPVLKDYSYLLGFIASPVDFKTEIKKIEDEDSEGKVLLRKEFAKAENIDMKFKMISKFLK